MLGFRSQDENRQKLSDFSIWKFDFPAYKVVKFYDTLCLRDSQTSSEKILKACAKSLKIF